MSLLDNQLEAARAVCGDEAWQPIADHIGDLSERIATMTAQRQQRGVQAQPMNVRIAPELIEWLRDYARSQSPPISINMAAAQAIEALRSSVHDA